MRLVLCVLCQRSVELQLVLFSGGLRVDLSADFMPTAPGKQHVSRIRGVISSLVSAVMNQCHCGFCRAFFATQSLESKLVLTSSMCSSYWTVTCSVFASLGKLRKFRFSRLWFHGFLSVFKALLCPSVVHAHGSIYGVGWFPKFST